MTVVELDLNGQIGCFFIGIILSVVLYGCTFSQVIYYFYHYTQDRKQLKFVGPMCKNNNSWHTDLGYSLTILHTFPGSCFHIKNIGYHLVLPWYY
ncbi:hypothetical protein POSPLADRAFT_1046811 [Postia placenta MAD-698-R-SB12]|uniref:Uncharacterized protein n=1 Tax=Postia placenta MAD-698-R-SB12 TaxID=670580 RepID=A0A1X6MYT3_9APHY|nr:hypothetical protein POSPLADRAFT_1046811 [Postia placenta MAD-698-R-SB12]OSX61410.1 hypothetical protein POSPLADRAFT_1046811 [Postia placenta MAD-698-R-SB12]